MRSALIGCINRKTFCYNNPSVTTQGADGFVRKKWADGSWVDTRQAAMSSRQGNFSVYCDGVFLGDDSEKLNRVDSTDSLADAICRMRKSVFHGVAFSGAGHEMAIFTDHLGHCPLVYYLDDNTFVFGSSFYAVVDAVKRLNNSHVAPSLVGAYSMLVQGCMHDAATLAEGIHTLKYGSLMLVGFGDNQSVRINQYYEIDNTPIDRPEDEVIDAIDDLFLDSVANAAEYNHRNGGPNWVTLSAGLDSRLVAFALERLGLARSIRAFTYAESSSTDCMTPMEICHDRGWSWYFKGLDAGAEIENLGESIRLSDGLVYFPWVYGQQLMLGKLQRDAVGLLLTGVMGDSVIGTYYENYATRSTYRVGDCCFSNRYVRKLETLLPPGENKRDLERALTWNRVINGISRGMSSGDGAVDAISPFMNMDLFDYCMHIPAGQRKASLLYHKWVVKRYPEACKYKLNGQRITVSKITVPYRGNRHYITRIPGMARAKLKTLVNPLRYAQEMNPFDKWYLENEGIRKAFDGFYSEHRDSLDFNSELQRDADELFKDGKALEKTLALSLVGGMSHVV